jgi:pimeloyl-ACP methyl ester carboxylesterase
LEQVKKTPCEVIRSSAKGLLAFQPAASLMNVHVPMLAVVTSENEAPFSLQNVLPSIRAHRMANTGHWVHLERPKEFYGLLIGFLAELERGTPLVVERVSHGRR